MNQPPSITMALHHDGHLQAYTDNLNTALKAHPALQEASLAQLILMAERLPKPIETVIKHNAGGVYNHRFFFAELAPEGNELPSGSLMAAIETSRIGSMGLAGERGEKLLGHRKKYRTGL